MADKDSVTNFTSLGLGAVVGAMVSAAATASLFIGGNVVVDLSQNPNPGTQVGTDSTLTFVERYSEDTATGSGSWHSKWVITNPYTATATLERLDLECDAWNRSISTDACITSNAGTGTGSCVHTLWDNVTIGTGSIKSLSGATLLAKLPTGYSVLVHTATGSVQTEDCKLKVRSHENFDT